MPWILPPSKAPSTVHGEHLAGHRRGRIGEQYHGVGDLLGGDGAAQGDAAYGQNVRVAGGIAPGSIDIDTATRTLKFDVEDEDGQLSVVYQGTVPDTFQEGNDVVVEGVLGTDGIFQAKTLVVKCPSKYEPE